MTLSVRNKIQHNDTQHNDTQHNDIEPKNKIKNVTLDIKTLSIMTPDSECCYAECHFY
jgi:hypothetical protein